VSTELKNLPQEKLIELIEEKDLRLTQIEFELAQLNRMIFGAKSERFVPAAHPSQLNLLEEPAI
jgi:hypothetical protein